MSKPSDTLARLRARTTEAGRFVLPLDPIWAEKTDAAYRSLRMAELSVDDEDPASLKRLLDAQAEVSHLIANAPDQVMIFKFRRLSRAQYDGVVSRNQPTAEQIKDEEDRKVPYGQRMIWNRDTFPIDLLHTVLIEPRLPREELEEMLNGPGLDSDEEPLLTKGEAESLMAAAMQTALSVPPMLPKELELP